MEGAGRMGYHSLSVLINQFLLAWISAGRFPVAIARAVLCLYWGRFILFYLG